MASAAARIGRALATMLRDQGRNDEARVVANGLLEIYPGVVPVQNLLQRL